MLRLPFAAALGAAALLSLPAAASAATTVGSDLSRADQRQWLQCPDGPCTIASSADGWNRADVPDGSIVTSWSAQLGERARARLRLLRVSDDGAMTEVARSEVVQGSAGGGVQTFPTHLVAPGGWVTVAIDILGGSVGVVPDTGFGTTVFSPAFGDGETRTSAYDRTGDELLVQARAESDDDQDGKGDETEDDCYFTCPPPPSPPTPPTTPTTPSPPSTPETPTTPAEDDTIDGKAPFTIDPRGMVRPGAQAEQGWFDIYLANNAKGDVTAKVTIKNGKRTVGTKTISDIEWADEEWTSFRLNAKERKQLLKRKKLRLSLTAKVEREGAAATTLEQKLTVLTGGDARYDGEYRGPGPFTISVDHGVIRSVSGSANAFCPTTNRFQMLSYFSPDGFPIVIGRDGKFDTTFNAVGQQMTYRGKLTRSGKGSGYASVFKSQLNIVSGKYVIDSCQGATNWTVTKAKSKR